MSNRFDYSCQGRPEPVTQLPEVDGRLRGSVDDWLAFLGGRSVEVGRLLGARAEEQDRAGYRHTLREISQQPLTWLETAEGVPGRLPAIAAALARVTGDAARRRSSSPARAARSTRASASRPRCSRALRVPVHAVAAGEVLTHPGGWLPPRGPCLLVSLARSGNSPESCGVLDSLRDSEIRHLVITCNRAGRLATALHATIRASPPSSSTTRPTTAAW